jgi:hypothetical protein
MNFIKKTKTRIKKYFFIINQNSIACLKCNRELTPNEISCPECHTTGRSYKMNVGGKEHIDRFKVLSAIIVSLLIIIAIVCSFNSISFFSKETLYWLFSAVLQAFAGLIAFLAAVVIFRMQVNYSELNNTADLIRQALLFFKGEAARSYTVTDIIREAADINPVVSQSSSKTEVNTVYVLYQRIIAAQQSNESAKQILKSSLAINLTVIISSLISLSLVEQISVHNIDISAVLFTIIYSIFALINTKKLLSFVH